MIEQINHIADLWWSGAVAMFWQVGVLIILIGCVDLIIRRWAWPQLRYALWLMVLVKLILPPTISLSTSITSGLQPLAKQIATKEIQRENLNTTAAMILANLETAVVESPVDAVSSRDTVTKQQPVLVFTGSENVAGESLSAVYVKPIWQAYVMAIWLAGMFALGGWLIIKLLHLRKEDPPPALTASLPASFYDSIARCAERLELRQVPKVILTRRVACPAVFGMVRPVLLMPVGYLSKMTRRDTENMLLHELAHIKRGDLWVHGFYMLLQVVYWYNPLLWLVRSQMHHLRELCCDATVARLLKERISEYRQTLIDVARRFLTKPTEPGLGLLGLFEDSNRLLVRLNWLKKETWRYQKMKKLTIITTIVLMLAFVLPMAQAQDKPSTEESSAGSVQAEEHPSHSSKTTEIEYEHQQNQEQSSQAMQVLQAQLKQLQFEKQKLQHELHALEHAKHSEHTEHAKHQAAEATLEAEVVKNKAIKASKEASKLKDMALKAKASAEALKAGFDAKRLEQWAKEMETWAKQYEAQVNSTEALENIDQLANNWALQWVNSDQFKQWQKDMEQWAKQYANVHEKAKSTGHVHTSASEHHPMPVMPPMDAIPAMPPEVVAKILVPPAPSAPQMIVAPAQPQPPAVFPKVTPPNSKTPPDDVSAAKTPADIAGPAPVMSDFKVELDIRNKHIEVHDAKDGKYVATKEMHFVSKMQPDNSFIIRNNLGNIILKPSKDDTCEVKAVIRARAKSAAEAQTMVEQVGMNLHSSDERYYLKSVKHDGGQWNNLSVDIHITVPPGVQPDIKTDLGNIEISNLKWNIKAVTNLGSIKAVNTTGDIELATNLGDIEFIASKNLSAKLQAQTKMGSIESDLPLEVSKPDMFKRTAEGTIGTGQASIKMATDMGKISLKWLPSSQDESKL